MGNFYRNSNRESTEMFTRQNLDATKKLTYTKSLKLHQISPNQKYVIKIQQPNKCLKVTGASRPLQIFHNKFPKVGRPIPYGYSQEYWSYILVLYSLLQPVTLGSLTLLAILSMAAPLALLSNVVNSGNYGFNSQVSQAGGDTSSATVLINVSGIFIL